MDKEKIDNLRKDTQKKLNNSFVDLQRRLKLPGKDRILKLTFHKEVPIAERLMSQNIYILEIQNEKGQTYYLGINEKEEKLLTIQQDGKIALAEDGEKKYAGMIGEKGKQTDAQREIYDYDKEKYVQQNEKGEIQLKDKQKEEGRIEQQKEQIVQADEEQLDSDSVMSIISISRSEQFGSALYKSIDKNAEIYLVKYKNGKFKLWQKDEAKYNELMGWEISDFGQQLQDELNLDPTKSGRDTIHEDELSLGETERSVDKFAVIQNRIRSDEQVIIEYDREGEATTSVFERDGIHAIKELKTQQIYPEKIHIDNVETEVNPNPQNMELNSMLNDSTKLEQLHKLKIIDEELETLEQSKSESRNEGNEEYQSAEQEIEELEEEKQYLLSEVGLDEQAYEAEKDDLYERERTMYPPPPYDGE